MADTPLAPPTETPQPPTSAAVGRRRFLAAAAGVTAALLVTDRIPGAGAAPRAATDDPFTLGVASGDPTPTGVVLWTRLAPRPLDPDGGMPARAVPVASPASGHAVHVEVDGLEPGRHYWYRFRAGGHLSRLGRTKTCPDPGTPLGRLALAFVSCQSWESGYYTAYRHLAEEDFDVVLHLGDYIYETASQPAARAATSRARRPTWPATGSATPSTRPTPTCRPRTPATRSPPPGTTTRSRTTTPAAIPSKAATRGSSCAAGPPPTGRTGSTCRCAARRTGVARHSS